jgi:hypothetical protein
MPLYGTRPTESEQTWPAMSTSIAELMDTMRSFRAIKNGSLV